jgi:hypothetical protein
VGQDLPRPCLKKLETFFIIRGRMLAGACGNVLRVGAGVLHRFTGLEPTLILEVSKPSILSDNYFEDPKFRSGECDSHESRADAGAGAPARTSPPRAVVQPGHP